MQRSQFENLTFSRLNMTSPEISMLILYKASRLLNLFFSSQTRVDDSNKDFPLLEPEPRSLNAVEILSMIEYVKDVCIDGLDQDSIL